MLLYTEILKSESLKDLFYIILVIGNMINAVSYIYLVICCYSNDVQGSRSGGAYGFTVTSLDNLRDTRANKPRMTFMHYIVSVSFSYLCIGTEPTLACRFVKSSSRRCWT